MANKTQQSAYSAKVRPKWCFLVEKVGKTVDDNGSENRGQFHQYLGQRGIAHYFIPKSSPTWDGAVERAHGVIDQEFYLNPTRPWKTLEEYLRFYNYERIHLGKYLNGLTPQEKWLEWLSAVSPLKVN